MRQANPVGDGWQPVFTNNTASRKPCSELPNTGSDLREARTVSAPVE